MPTVFVDKTQALNKVNIVTLFFMIHLNLKIMSKLQGLKLVELGWKCRSLVSSLPRLPLQTLSIFNLPLKKI